MGLVNMSRHTSKKDREQKITINCVSKLMKILYIKAQRLALSVTKNGDEISFYRLCSFHLLFISTGLLLPIYNVI